MLKSFALAALLGASVVMPAMAQTAAPPAVNRTTQDTTPAARAGVPASQNPNAPMGGGNGTGSSAMGTGTAADGAGGK